MNSNYTFEENRNLGNSPDSEEFEEFPDSQVFWEFSKFL